MPSQAKVRILNLLVQSAMVEDEELLGIISKSLELLGRSSRARSSRSKTPAKKNPKDVEEAEKRLRGHPGVKLGEDEHGDTIWMFREFRHTPLKYFFRLSSLAFPILPSFTS